MRFKPGQEVTLKRRESWMPQNAPSQHGSVARFGKVYTVSDVDEYNNEHYISLIELHPNDFYHESEFEPVQQITEAFEILQSEEIEV